MKIAHISDLHFAKMSYNPFQLFTKRIIGNLNYLYNRRKLHKVSKCYDLLPLFKDLGVDLVVITGDFSTTSYKKEFELARSYLRQLQGMGMDVVIVPGNHDNYTSSAYTHKLFYQFLGSVVDFDSDEPFSYSLNKDLIQVRKIDGYWLIMLDTTLSTPLIYSNGVFQKKLEKRLSLVLDKIPQNEKVIIVNHFPLFKQDGKLKDLKRVENLQAITKKHPNILFYLHGHTHRHSIADLRGSHFPIVMDAGSMSLSKTSRWNLLDLTDGKIDIQVFESKDDKPWEKISSYDFSKVEV